eukprot:CAMPEP_0197008802 /NCGR_PEP_ID=MMETSP1380-20130617/46969_1 /TAXON_ID=5936 /ORGANISM="Euplotes crassus, Strain CT5" /LENGTH=51 /DNA_ID=CAMNT_0042429613 /DNA_START=49 /DNA_END=201 /DNA_ORIENTATION=-
MTVPGFLLSASTKPAIEEEKDAEMEDIEECKIDTKKPTPEPLKSESEIQHK